MPLKQPHQRAGRFDPQLGHDLRLELPEAFQFCPLPVEIGLPFVSQALLAHQPPANLVLFFFLGLALFPLGHDQAAGRACLQLLPERNLFLVLTLGTGEDVGGAEAFVDKRQPTLTISLSCLHLARHQHLMIAHM